METTSGPWKGPLARVSILVTYIGTFRPALDMAHRDAGALQRFLEGKRTANDEGDEIVTPDIGEVGDPVAPPLLREDPVERHIGRDIEILAERDDTAITGPRHAEKRAWLGIVHTEAEEIIGKALGQDHEITLQVAARPGPSSGLFE